MQTKLRPAWRIRYSSPGFSANVQVVRLIICLPCLLNGACCFGIIYREANYKKDHCWHAHVRRRDLTDMPTFRTLSHSKANLTLASDSLGNFVEVIT